MSEQVIPATRPRITEPGFQSFIRISARLTGFSEEELLGTGMQETYYYVIMKELDQDNVRAFFGKTDEILNGKKGIEENIRKYFIPPCGETPYAGLAQRIILMWYTGIWTTMNGSDTKKPDQRTAMISAATYQQGLIWTVAETHPAGARQPGYNSWSKPPL
jgi:hypothetical protein